MLIHDIFDLINDVHTLPAFMAQTFCQVMSGVEW